MNELIGKMVMPVVLAGCYALGMALKSTKMYPDEWIPLTLFGVGALLAPFISQSFTVETIVIGAMTGWASVGLNQSVKQSGKSQKH